MTKRFPVIPSHSRETAKLIELLTSTDKDTITDAELAAEVGESCAPGGKAYSKLATAIRYVRRNGDRVWARVRGAKAVSRIRGVAGTRTADTMRTTIRRKAEAASQVLALTSGDTMTDDERKHHSALAAQLGTVALMTKTDTTKALVARQATVTADRDSVLKLFEK